ncbi:TorD/DmsD family molecular chaperone [Shewanella phaeophyticola]|uniref:Molecular chaperone TorD family protein n=1 Tax=Shewanella phaeophyticola TaxID=2978345 RepID=A0ABT2P6E5_9GAMM|nr:molecular chaperone TorD family protein [Shewanella sp. KJ10-1]MCT8987951.1 molecular chaperone TorD family protein [Shewanella sp. KJ10-1]
MVCCFTAGTPRAAPWGSAYTSSSQLLNDASTMELKQFYVSHNINIDMKSNEPVDHIGLILAVLAYLLNKLIEKPQSSYYQSTINQLLEQHLLPWAYRCLALAYAHAETDYFKGFAILTREYFFHLEEVFELKTKQMAIYR